MAGICAGLGKRAFWPHRSARAETLKRRLAFMFDVNKVDVTKGKWIWEGEMGDGLRGK